MRKREETALIAHIMVAVTAIPESLWERMNTGASQSATGRVVRFGIPGGPDIRGVLRGRAVAIECKTATGRLSTAQRIWQQAFLDAGGLYILARSLDDVLPLLT